MYSNHKIVGDVVITFNSKELFRPTVPIGAKVSVHSKDEIINPFIDGFLVRPGNRYIVQLKVIEEDLLTNPYSTNCSYYEQSKEKSFDELYTRQRCILNCQKEKWLESCGCISGDYPFETDGIFCSEHKLRCIHETLGPAFWTVQTSRNPIESTSRFTSFGVNNGTQYYLLLRDK
ncbi:amiloride-sensitive sodium channel subunit alpha-like [Centruroides sculpturatus]|uniref:amiloride-sensitive sodium channel subunit alpha-like n=1 Tax=Centruroides sculpturatus TaxID=218467 RepID=UPI000C6D0412|nr:amiloride-sensitive sodium channel subunit alpha-like [Centruroides sculpturatus]